ncbi:hypothetical protein [Nonomuraea indica]|uniref:hypothetical protein n=1 Tax=Nonomuraea indica TaxID=1581193 RepID=UPI000C79D16C|nr:hypothetical protein [Nonomuraea indica]
MGTQSVLCSVCQGVLPATGRESYTALRGRLIVTNGYCAGGCAERLAEAERAREMARPAAPAPQLPQAPHAQGPAPVRMAPVRL